MRNLLLSIATLGLVAGTANAEWNRVITRDWAEGDTLTATVASNDKSAQFEILVQERTTTLLGRVDLPNTPTCSQVLPIIVKVDENPVRNIPVSTHHLNHEHLRL